MTVPCQFGINNAARVSVGQPQQTAKDQMSTTFRTFRMIEGSAKPSGQIGGRLPSLLPPETAFWGSRVTAVWFSEISVHTIVSGLPYGSRHVPWMAIVGMPCVCFKVGVPC